MLRRFADEFEADTYGAASEAFRGWVATVAGLDVDGDLHVATEIMCWGDGFTPDVRGGAK